MRLVPDRYNATTKTLVLNSNPAKKIRWLEYRVLVSHGTRTEVRRTYLPWSVDGDFTPVIRTGRKLGGTHIQAGPTRITLLTEAHHEQSPTGTTGQGH